MDFTFEEKNTRQRHPPGGDPHSRSTHGAGARKGAWAPIRAGEARAASEGRGVYGRGEKKEKGDCGELQLAVCKRKAAANANQLAYEGGGCSGKCAALVALTGGA